jgi:hypothetical protein
MLLAKHLAVLSKRAVRTENDIGCERNGSQGGYYEDNSSDKTVKKWFMSWKVQYCKVNFPYSAPLSLGLNHTLAQTIICLIVYLLCHIY